MRPRLKPIQVLILINLIIVCFFLSISGVLIDKLEDIGIALSILGTWLSAIGIIGKKRLDSWETALTTNLNSPNTESEKVSDNIKDNFEKLIWKSKLWKIFFIIVIPLIFLYYLDIIFPQVWNSSPIFNDLFALLTIIFTVFVFIMVIFPIIFAHTFVLFLAIISFPYRIIIFIDKDAALERTILLIGTILLTFGIIIMQ